MNELSEFATSLSPGGVTENADDGRLRKDPEHLHGLDQFLHLCFPLRQRPTQSSESPLKRSR